jgi:hypothetical protein
MATTTFSKTSLSNSSYGKQILISATTSGSATPIHTTQPSGSLFTDEIYLYAYNDSTSSLQCNILWGGTSEPNDVIRSTIPSQSGRTLLVDGKILQNGLSVQAYAQIANAITMDGFVNRISISGGVIIDPVVANWALRVSINGGASPSTNTQIALTTFMQSLYNNNIYSKMISVNCLVPDNLIAASTPLIFIAGNSLWTNHNFVSGDLTVNGLLGNGSSKYFQDRKSVV